MLFFFLDDPSRVSVLTFPPSQRTLGIVSVSESEMLQDS